VGAAAEGHFLQVGLKLSVAEQLLTMAPCSDEVFLSIPFSSNYSCDWWSRTQPT